MELFLLLLDLQSKNYFYKNFLTFKNESKTGFENRKLNYFKFASDVFRCSYWSGDTAHKMYSAVHRTAQDFKLMQWDGWVGNYSENNATSWLHLASLNLPDSQLS